MAALLMGCGGKSSGNAAGNNGGPSGSAGAPNDTGCSDAGKDYADGASFRASDGCNTCVCNNGSIACTGVDCVAVACNANGNTVPVGATFTDASGNECLCNPDGTASCKSSGGAPPISCEQVATFYDEMVRAAKACDPHQPNPCTLLVSDGLGCGCDTYVDPANWNQPMAAAYSSHYQGLSCDEGMPCIPCRVPLSGHCSIMDGCQDVYADPD